MIPRDTPKYLRGHPQAVCVARSRRCAPRGRATRPWSCSWMRWGVGGRLPLAGPQLDSGSDGCCRGGRSPLVPSLGFPLERSPRSLPSLRTLPPHAPRVRSPCTHRTTVVSPLAVHTSCPDRATPTTRSCHPPTFRSCQLWLPVRTTPLFPAGHNAPCPVGPPLLPALLNTGAYSFPPPVALRCRCRHPRAGRPRVDAARAIFAPFFFDAPPLLASSAAHQPTSPAPVRRARRL